MSPPMRWPLLRQQVLFPEHQFSPELIVGVLLFGEAVAFVHADQVPGAAALGADGGDGSNCFIRFYPPN